MLLMEKVNIFGKIIENMKENGSMEKWKGKVYLNGLMEEDLKGII